MNLHIHMSCACTAASVAMVIYAHSPHLNEPLCGGSPLGSIRVPKILPRSRNLQ